MYEVDKFVDRNFFSQCVTIFGGEKFRLPLISLLTKEKSSICLRFEEIKKWIADPSVLSKRQYRALALAAAAAEYYNGEIVLNAIKSISCEFDVFLEAAVLLIARDAETIRVVQNSLMFQERESVFEYVFAASVLSANSDENRVRLGVLSRRIDELLTPESISTDDPVVYATVANMAITGFGSNLAVLLKRAFKSVPQRYSGIMACLREYGFTYSDVCRILYFEYNATVELGVAKNSDRRKERIGTAVMSAMCPDKNEWSDKDKCVVAMIIKSWGFDSMPTIKNDSNRAFIQSMGYYCPQMFFDADKNLSNTDIFMCLCGDEMYHVVSELEVSEFSKLLHLRDDLPAYVKNSYYTRTVYKYCLEAGLITEEDDDSVVFNADEALQKFLKINRLEQLDKDVTDYLLAYLNDACLLSVTGCDVAELLRACEENSLPSVVLQKVLQYPESYRMIIQFYTSVCGCNRVYFEQCFESALWAIMQESACACDLTTTEVCRASSVKWIPTGIYDKWLLWVPEDVRVYVTKFQRSEKYPLFCRMFAEFGVDTNKRVTKSVVQYYGLPKSLDKENDRIQNVCIWLKLTEHPLADTVTGISDWSGVADTAPVFNKQFLESLRDKCVSGSLPDILFQEYSMKYPEVFEDVSELNNLRVCKEASSVYYLCGYTDLQTACIVKYGARLSQVSWIDKDIIFKTAEFLHEACREGKALYRNLQQYNVLPFCEMLAKVLVAYVRGQTVFSVGMQNTATGLLEEWKSLATLGIKDLLYSEDDLDFLSLNENRIRVTGISVLTEVSGQLSIVTESISDIMDFAEKWNLPVYVQGNYPYSVRNYGSPLGKSLDWLPGCNEQEFFTARLLEVFEC